MSSLYKKNIHLRIVTSVGDTTFFAGAGVFFIYTLLRPKRVTDALPLAYLFDFKVFQKMVSLLLIIATNLIKEVGHGKQGEDIST